MYLGEYLTDIPVIITMLLYQSVSGEHVYYENITKMNIAQTAGPLHLSLNPTLY